MAETKTLERADLSRKVREKMSESIRRFGVVLLLATTPFLWSDPTRGQDASDTMGRLGPVPQDQQESERGRTATVPLVQRDAYDFARSGERLLRMEPRIVGGAPAPIGAYPWQISIALIGLPTSIGHFCGGSVVGDDWVVTAAHCVDGTTKPESLKLVYGTNFLSQGGQEVEVRQIIVHEKWDSAAFDYDVALIQTKQPIETTQIKLVVEKSAPELVPVGVLGTVSGWGLTTEGGTISDVLQHVGVQVTSNQICNGPTAYFGQISERMLCAGFATGGKDSCQGDSGGPFVVFDRVGGYALAGIVSWGEGCAQPNKFGVYTRVSSVAEWISQHIAE